jgi:hypothetical protein
MAVLRREFYRDARGPTPGDQDVWSLVFDRVTGELLVRHEWDAERHSGVDEFGIGEFVTQTGAAPDALLSLLFADTSVDAQAAK